MDFEATIVSRRYDPSAAIHAVHEFNLFVPNGTEPVGGWPVVVSFQLAGYSVTQTKETITEADDGNLHAYLKRGIAVVSAHLPPSRSDVIVTLPDKVQGSFDPNSNQFGPAYPRGSGAIVIHTGNGAGPWPGDNPPSYVGTHPWVDPDWVMPEKAAVYLVQHLRYHGRGGTGELPLNPAKMVLEAGSAGAATALFPASAPDMAGKLGLTGGQNDVSTRVLGAALTNAPVLFSIYVTTVNGVHFARIESLPTWPAPACYEEPAPTLASTNNAWRYHCSPWVYGTQLGNLAPDVEGPNADVHFWMSYVESISAAFLANATRYTNPPFSTESNLHSAANGYLWKKAYPHTRLVIGATAALDPNPGSGGGVAQDAIITDAAQLEADRYSWVVQLLAPLPVEEQAIRAVESALAEITAANGYQTTVQAVHRWSSAPDDMAHDVIVMTRNIGTVNVHHEKLSTNRVQKQTVITLDLMVRGLSHRDEQLSAFIADVEKRLYLEEKDGGYLGDLIEHMHMAEWVRVLPQESNVNWALVRVDVTVTYSHLIGDPYTPLPPATP